MHKCMYLFGIYFGFWLVSGIIFTELLEFILISWFPGKDRLLGSPQIFSKVKVGVLERLFQKFMVKLLYPLFNILLTV